MRNKKERGQTPKDTSAYKLGVSTWVFFSALATELSTSSKKVPQHNPPVCVSVGKS